MSEPIDIETLTLKSGSHHSRTSGVCAMEAVAWLAGEEHSDSPACASAVIAAFMRNWNDSLPSDDDRDRLLKPLLPRLIGTSDSAEIENQRSWMAMNWLARECAPAFLALTPALTPHADALWALAPLTDADSLAKGKNTLAAARDAARDAARAAAWAAARDAARDAAWDAAWDTLRPTVERLQESAQQLVIRMCELTEVSHD